MLRNQRGYVGGLLLIGFLLAASSAAYITMIDLKDMKRVQGQAEEAGRALQQYSFGVMKLISEQGLSVTPGTYTGTGWLKSASCPGGTATRPYISDCSMRDKMPLSSNYQTTVSIVGAVVQTVTTVDWPSFMNEKNPVLAAIVRQTAAGYIAGTSPVAQTFSDYSLDEANKKIVVSVSTSVSTDIWWRTDGSNQLNADGNVGGNSLYGVSAIYGGGAASVDTSTLVEIGSAVNVAGVMEVGKDGSGTTYPNSYLRVNGADTGNLATGYSIVALGSLSALNGDFTGRIVVGDTSGYSEIQLADGSVDNASNIRLKSSSGDLLVTNTNSDATLIADRIYIPSVNRYVDQAAFNFTMVKNGDFIPKPVCPAGLGLVPQIFLGLSGVAQNPGRPITAFDVRGIDLGAQWQVNLRLKTDGPGNVPDAMIESSIWALVKCS